MPAVLDYILKTVKYQGEVPMSGTGWKDIPNLKSPVNLPTQSILCDLHGE